MFLSGFFWGMVVGSLVTQLIIYVAVRRHRAKVGTPSASHNKPSAPCSRCGGSGVATIGGFDGLDDIPCPACTAHVG